MLANTAPECFITHTVQREDSGPQEQVDDNFLFLEQYNHPKNPHINYCCSQFRVITPRLHFMQVVSCRSWAPIAKVAVYG